MSIRYCEIHEFSKLNEVVQLEMEVWGVAAVDVFPTHALWAVIHNGGVLVGAYDGDVLVGMCLGFSAKRGRDSFIWSHMAGVRQEFQGSGLGTELKLVQRNWCLSNDYTKIRWTFDPLQRGNANFNIHKLGAIANTYYINYYGEMVDSINAGLPSDRLEVTWDLTIPQPIKRDNPKDLDPAGEMLLVSVDSSPILSGLQQRAKQLYIEIPADLARLKAADSDLALRWRLATREAFQTAFSHHYTVTDFIKIDERQLYVLSAPESWYLYVAECSDQTLYTGITNNLQRRMDQHNAGKGAAYTASRRPITLLAAWRFPDRSTAQRAEAAFKKQNRQTKLGRIQQCESYLDGKFLSSL